MGSTHALYDHLLADLALFREVLPNDPTATSQEVAASLLRSKAFSKFEGDYDKKAAKEKALGAFVEVNRECRAYRFPNIADLSEVDQQLIGEIRKVLHDFFHVEESRTIFDVPLDSVDFGVGPGASNGSSGETDIYTKLFSGPISGTNRVLLRMYDKYVCRDNRRFLAESNRTANFGNPAKVFGLRVSSVFKNVLIERTIGIEAAINMGIQLMLGQLIVRRDAEYFGIDIQARSADPRDCAQPEVNKLLAIRFSVTDSGATVDLKQASDSQATSMWYHLLQMDALRPLLIARSPFGEINGEQHLLHMIGTMGNGYTFPLQTTLFAAIVFASRRLVGKGNRKASLESGWSVFGDDIICENDELPLVLRALDLLGFKVNEDKTYLTGPFRESCGVDAYRGINVRPVYIRRLTTKQHLFTAINRLLEWCVRHDIVLEKSMEWLFRNCGKVNYIPAWASTDAGVRVPESRASAYDRNGSCLYQSYEPVTRKVTFKLRNHRFIVNPDGVAYDDTANETAYNGNGLLLSFLHGSLRTERIAADSTVYKIGVRSNPSEPTRYRLKMRLAPNWVHVDPRRDTLNPLERRRWNASWPLYVPMACTKTEVGV